MPNDQLNTSSPVRQRVRLIIRISQNALSFAVGDPTAPLQVDYEPYPVRNGISIAANLREAFKQSELLNKKYNRALVLIDSPVLLVPISEFDESEKETIYHHTFSGMEGNAILQQILPDQNAVALFSINKDLKTVIEDHFDNIRFIHLVQPVWNYLQLHSFNGVRQKLYCYFHDKKLEVFTFEKKRFRFCNSFDADHSHDAVYYILYVWKQLGLDVQHDEIYLVGEIPEIEWMTEALHNYVKKVFKLNSRFSELQINKIASNPLTVNMPFDIQTLYINEK